VQAYDPVALDEARRVFALDLADRGDEHARLAFEASQEETLSGADALIVLTEWKEFKSPDFMHMKSVLKSPVIFDGRNLYEPQAMAELGIDYYAIGRPYVPLQSATDPHA